MGDDNLQDALATLISVISFATAVIIAATALTVTRDMNMIVSKRVDNKQSIRTTYDYDLASARASRTDKTLTRSQVLEMILGMNDKSIEIRINGSIIPGSILENARRGIKSGVLTIEGMLTGATYYMKTIYDTQDGMDYIKEIQYRSS